MARTKGIFLIVILLCILSQQGYSQVSSISGVINAYTPIDSIYSYEINNVDSLIVQDASLFGMGDTVMVYCVQGAKIATDTIVWEDDEIGRDAQLPRNTGKYAFVIIDEVDPVRNLVVLNTNLRPEMNPLGDGEVAQLIRVPSYRNAEVKPGGVTASAWNGSTGGVVAMFVHGVLKLNGNINVNGKGFRGAEEDVNYLGNCSADNPVLYDSAFYLFSNVKAGKKGEGTTDTRFDRTRGKAMNINGGGGGNALFSGGGGGSNFNSGGKGGNESSPCGPGVVSPGGAGGYNLSDASSYYINGNPQGRGNRIFFGGGGGAGTRMAGRTSTNGGDGGGLVVIVADTIIGNNKWIYADGTGVTSAATGSGGGGGGGGGIILDVSGYKTVLNLSAVGGKGGNTNHPIDTTGPGGGGGGGVYWMAGTTQPGVSPNLFSNGPAGEYITGTNIKYGATDGGSPGKRTQLLAPIRGFLFNSVPSEFTICSDWDPDPILASVPKGGNGPGSYTYQWVDSSSTQKFWDIAPGASTSQNYDPGLLSDTTYFRRIVYSGILPADTSFRIVIYVHPAITNNTITAPDTVCKGNQPQLPFIPSASIGGGPTNGIYKYKWQKDEGSGYTAADGPSAINGESYQAPGLDTTTNFARIAYAGVCVDTSAPLLVKVWESLDDFEITPNDTVCYNTESANQLTSLTGLPPINGDQDDISYQWMTSANTTDWVDVDGETSESYQPPALTQTTYYRRMVLSGSDDACIETSDYVEILNIPLINNNTISETQTVCTGDQPDLLAGTIPTGGVPGQYKYLWESSTASTGWVAASGINDISTNYNPGLMNGDTTFYRRVVGSGGVNRNVCRSFQLIDVVAINVLPPILNNTITVADAVKCQGEQVDPLNGTIPSGGDNVWTYKWEVAAGQDNPDSWLTIGADEVSITDPSPLDSEHDRWYKRIIFSGPGEGEGQVCKDTTTFLQVTVHTGIRGNTIVPLDSVCYADTKLLLGDIPTGEVGLTPVYTWKDMDNDLDLPGSDQEDFTTTPFMTLGNFSYKRKVQIGECTDTSGSMVITVMELPGGTLTDVPFRACEQDIELAIDLNMDGLQSYVLPWEVTLKNGVASGIGPIPITGDGGLPVTLDIDTDSLQLYYELETITYHSVGGRYSCTAPAGNMSGVVPIHVFRKPAPQILVDGEARDIFKVCNTTAELVAIADNGTGSWSSDPSGTVFFSSGSGQDEYLASIPNQHEAFGIYNLTYASEAGDCIGEDFIEMHYFEQPDPAFAGTDTVIFLINSIQLKADPPTAGLGTWKQTKGDGIIADEHSHNTYVNELAMGEENTFNWTITNGEDEGECSTSSDVTIVLRSEVKRYEGFSPNGDMNNEYFIMQGLAYADEFTISFFNALGKPVRTITHENVDEMVIDPSLITNGLREDEIVVWDGRATNGNLVPSGTYYYAGEFWKYQVKYDITGYVVVIRE